MPEQPVPLRPEDLQVAPAVVGRMRAAALRAVDDPVALGRAARIVRAALARRVIVLRDLQGDIVSPEDIRWVAAIRQAEAAKAAELEAIAAGRAPAPAIRVIG